MKRFCLNLLLLVLLSSCISTDSNDNVHDLDVDIGLESILLVNTSIDEDFQYIIDYKDLKKIQIKNYSYYGGTKDSKGRYWLVSDEQSNTTNIDVFDDNEKVLSLERNGFGTFQQINSTEELIVYAELGKDNISEVTFMDYNGQESTKLGLDYFVWDIEHQENDFYIGGHEILKDYGVLIVYDHGSSELVEVKLYPELIPVDIVLNEEHVYVLQYNHINELDNGKLTIINGQGVKNTLDILPLPYSMELVNNNVYILHRSFLDHTNVIISKIDLESNETYSYKMGNYSEVIFEEDYFFMIDPYAKIIDKYDYDMNLIYSNAIDFYNDGAIIILN